MIARDLCIFALLVAFASATIDCSQENTCFGEPMNCNPDSSCKTLFRFDEQGNLDLYLHNFTEQMGYAAFPVKKLVIASHDMHEYFICIPHQGQVLHAFADLKKQVLLITEQNSTGVEQHDFHDFRCRFNVAKLPKEFQQRHEFFVSTGIFAVPLVIANGVQLHKVMSNFEYYIPSTRYIGGSFDSDLPTEFIFTPEDGKALTETIQEMQSLSDTAAEDVEMEKLARKVENTRQITESRDEEESSEDENTPRRRDYKETRQHSKGQVPSRSDEDEDQEVDEYTPRRRENSKRRDSEDSRRGNTKSRDTEEDEESEDEYTPRRRDTKRGRPSRYEEDLEKEENDDESSKRRSTRKDKKNSDEEEDYESEDNDDEYDGYDNASNVNIVYIVFLAIIHRFL